MSNRNHDGEQPSKSDYEVGYGRPPKETQFKAGQSGNSKGSKRKPKSVQAQMQAVLLRKVPITENGQTKRLSLQEVILRNLASKAAKGDLKAAAFVLNLLMSPEYADAETIDQTGLSPDDQAMFEEMLRQLTGVNDSDQPSSSSGFEEESAEGDLSATHAEIGVEPRTPTDKEG